MPRRSGLGLAAILLCLAAGFPAYASGRGSSAEERRFETAIQQNLKTYFRMNPAIEERAITVHVDDNTVTLRGEVPDWRTHDQVIEAARLTNGVSKVVDELTVRAPPLPGRSITTTPRAAETVPLTTLSGPQR